jgi:hypothetical protein
VYDSATAISTLVPHPPMCPSLRHPDNGLCRAAQLFAGSEAACWCFPGYEFPAISNVSSVQRTLRCEASSSDQISHTWTPEENWNDCILVKKVEERKEEKHVGLVAEAVNVTNKMPQEVDEINGITNQQQFCSLQKFRNVELSFQA